MTDSDRQIAVVALDDSTEVGALMKSTSELLDRQAYDVVVGERLARRLAEHQAAPIPGDISAKFAGIANTIGDGVKSFFYKGNETAVAKLSPIFDLGMGHPEVLARRPDFAKQIFQAGLVLVRAYRNLKQSDNAEAAASLLVRRMPATEPSPSFAPPEIIRFFERQRRALAERGARLNVDEIGGDECATYVNGSSVGERDKPLIVAPDETYYLTLECGRAATPVWKTRLASGQKATIPISGSDPLGFSMSNANFRQRKFAESYLKLVAHWSDVSRVIGVYSPRNSTDSEQERAVLIVRVDDGGETTWSDTVESAEIRGALARVMPGLDPAASPQAAGAPRSRTDHAGWLDWTLAGLGVAGLTGGTYLGVVTEHRARRVQCSTGARTDCDGLQPLRLDNSAEIRRAEREINAARAAYLTSLAAGAGLATWGIVRLATRPKNAPKQRAAGRINLGLAPTPRNPRAFLHIRW